MSLSPLPPLPRQDTVDTFVHSIVQNIQNLFRFRVGILPGLGWGRIKNYHLAFGIQAQVECNIRYLTYILLG